MFQACRNGPLQAELDVLTTQHGYGKLQVSEAPSLFDYQSNDGYDVISPKNLVDPVQLSPSHSGSDDVILMKGLADPVNLSL